MLILTVDPKDMGQATAMNNVFRNLGSSVGTPIVGSILAAYVINYYGTTLPRLIAFQYAFWIGAAIVLVGGVFVLFGQEVLGPRRHKKFAHHPQLHGLKNIVGETSAEPAQIPALAH
jgi:MFS family permease